MLIELAEIILKFVYFLLYTITLALFEPNFQPFRSHTEVIIPQSQNFQKHATPIHKPLLSGSKIFYKQI